ncbi:alpha/beta hydrolase [Affinibrenneria salicis]|uniref:Alpha/beta hydrolase n=1 Tax=Affinibrenneria salicis TaxID=2590031 RepID=A0A5J5G4C7_9GAMM|nr:alpha/beta hydrolase [Affinibrenneria salicis]KAA9001880.1 alpha/beta hydrolase [Affinibrenneria salicis]
MGESTLSCTLNDEYKLHYRTEGNGPLVVLIHGLLMNGESWRQSGLVQVLRERCCVAYPDLLGHGMSDKPVTSGPYDQDKQAAGMVRLINEAGYRKAHIIGYSSGAWLALGMAKYYPQHLSSLLIGGWDVENGLPDGPNGSLSFDEFLNYAKLTAPELTK